MKVLVLGDSINDHYLFCKATRLCPEAPAPVLQVLSEENRDGGAGLVWRQLLELGGVGCATVIRGSMSLKKRIFADRTLVCRIDTDSISVAHFEESKKSIFEIVELNKFDAVVVSDYAKGAMTKQLAGWLMEFCARYSIPVFVDTKNDPMWYAGAYAFFPNEHEHVSVPLLPGNNGNIIRKLGANGCSVNGRVISTAQRQVYDVTGAGDVFLAAFVYHYLAFPNLLSPLIAAASFANKAAGISVQHLGTHVVTHSEIENNRGFTI